MAIQATCIIAHCMCVLMMHMAPSNGLDIIDTFEPVMRCSPELDATKEDLFGYTLVLHQLNATGGIDNTRLAL